MAELLYFDAAHAIKIHDWIIANSGGRTGIVNIDLLEGPLAHIQNDDYYPDLISKLTHLCYSINKAHAFNDGNKRSSIALSALFMHINGLEAYVKRFVVSMEEIAVLVADNYIDKSLLQRLIESIIYDGEFSEELKVALLHANIQFANNRHLDDE